MANVYDTPKRRPPPVAPKPKKEGSQSSIEDDVFSKDETIEGDTKAPGYCPDDDTSSKDEKVVESAKHFDKIDEMGTNTDILVKGHNDERTDENNTDQTISQRHEVTESMYDVPRAHPPPVTPTERDKEPESRTKDDGSTKDEEDNESAMYVNATDTKGTYTGAIDENFKDQQIAIDNVYDTPKRRPPPVAPKPSNRASLSSIEGDAQSLVTMTTEGKTDVTGYRPEDDASSKVEKVEEETKVLGHHPDDDASSKDETVEGDTKVSGYCPEDDAFSKDEIIEGDTKLPGCHPEDDASSKDMKVIESAKDMNKTDGMGTNTDILVKGHNDESTDENNTDQTVSQRHIITESVYDVPRDCLLHVTPTERDREPESRTKDDGSTKDEEDNESAMYVNETDTKGTYTGAIDENFKDQQIAMDDVYDTPKRRPPPVAPKPSNRASLSSIEGDAQSLVTMTTEGKTDVTGHHPDDDASSKVEKVEEDTKVLGHHPDDASSKDETVEGDTKVSGYCPEDDAFSKDEIIEGDTKLPGCHPENDASSKDMKVIESAKDMNKTDGMGTNTDILVKGHNDESTDENNTDQTVSQRLIITESVYDVPRDRLLHVTPTERDKEPESSTKDDGSTKDEEDNESAIYVNETDTMGTYTGAVVTVQEDENMDINFIDYNFEEMELVYNVPMPHPQPVEEHQSKAIGAGPDSVMHTVAGDNAATDMNAKPTPCGKDPSKRTFEDKEEIRKGVPVGHGQAAEHAGNLPPPPSPHIRYSVPDSPKIVNVSDVQSVVTMTTERSNNETEPRPEDHTSATDEKNVHSAVYVNKGDEFEKGREDGNIDESYKDLDHEEKQSIYEVPKSHPVPVAHKSKSIFMEKDGPQSTEIGTRADHTVAGSSKEKDKPSKKDPLEKTYVDMEAFRKEMAKDFGRAEKESIYDVPKPHPVPVAANSKSMFMEKDGSQSKEIGTREVADSNDEKEKQSKKDPLERTYVDMEEFQKEMAKGAHTQATEQADELTPPPHIEHSEADSTKRTEIGTRADHTVAGSSKEKDKPSKKDPLERTYVDMEEFQKEMAKVYEQTTEQNLDIPPPLPPRPCTLLSASQPNRPPVADISAATRHTYAATHGKDSHDRIYIDMTLVRGAGWQPPDARLNEDVTEEIGITGAQSDAETVSITDADEEIEIAPAPAPPAACTGAFVKDPDDYIETDQVNEPIVQTRHPPEAQGRGPNQTDQSGEGLMKNKLTNGNKNSGGSGYFSSEESNKIEMDDEKTRELMASSMYVPNETACVIVREIPCKTRKEVLEKILEKAGIDLNNVKSIYLNDFEAVIGFHNAKDAKQCSMKKLMLDETPLRSDLYDLDEDPYKAFITGLPRNTTKETLYKYLNEVSVECTDIQMGLTPGTVMATFRSPSDIDLLGQQCDKRPLEGHILEVYSVPLPKTLKIEVQDHSVSFIQLQMYLNEFLGYEGNKSRIIWEDSMKSYIAHLRSYEDVEAICKDTVHDLGGFTITVSPYYPCLGLDRNYFVVPTPIELHGEDKYFALFATGSQTYKDHFQERLKQRHAVLYHPCDTGQCWLLCSLDSRAPRTKQIIENWSSECLKMFKMFTNTFLMNRVHVAEECWEDVLLTLLNTDEHWFGRCVSAMDLNTEDCSFVLVGEEAYVKDITNNISGRETQYQELTRKKKMEQYQYEIMKIFVGTNLWKKSKPIPIISDENRVVCFKGTREDTRLGITYLYGILDNIGVENETAHLAQSAKVSYLDDPVSVVRCRAYVQASTIYLNIFSETTKPRDLIFGYSGLAKKLLKTEQTSTYIKDKMSKIKLVATYDVIDRDVKVYVLNKKELKKAKEVLTSSLRIKQHRLQTNEVKDSVEWKQKLYNLYERYNGRFLVDLTSNEMELVSLNIVFEEVYNELLECIDSFTMLNTTFELDLGKWRFIEAYRKDEIVKIKASCEKANVWFVESSSLYRKGFAFRGKKGDCKTMIKMLQDLVDSIYHHSFPFALPFLHQIVRTEDCVQGMLVSEIKAKCGLHVESIVKEKPSLPKEVAGIEIFNHQIILTEGDITRMLVDGVVNPVDNCLQNIGATSASLVDNEGYSFQTKCDEFIRNKGEMEPGRIYFYKSTKEHRKCIISVAVPFWTDDMNNKQLLRLAIQNSLKEAVQTECITVVIPALDNTHNYPVEVSANVIVQAVTEFFASTIKPESRLMKVYLCASTPLNRSAFEDALRPHAKYRSSLIESDIKIHVIQGQLAKQKTDAIVTAVTYDLNLRIGAIPHSLLQEGGECLQQECNKNYPQGIKQGEVAVTSGANLKCQKVFYGALEKWDNGKGHAEKVLGIFIEKCLSMASKLGLASIAFPALGTGKMGFEPKFVAELLQDCLYTFKLQNPPTTLKDVYLVVFPDDQMTLQGFKDTLTDGKPSGRYRPFAPVFFERDTKFRKSFENLSVEIVNGDITKEKTHTIVNSVNNLDLDTGSVSKAIFNAAGPSIQTECSTQENKQAMNKDGFVETACGNLDYCWKIIHLEARDTKSQWTTSIKKCLEAAERRGYKSLSFPALGTGGRGCDPETIASAMFSAIRTFSQSLKGHQNLRHVRIVIFNQKMIQTFIEAALGKRKSFRLSVFQKAEEKEDRNQTVTFHLYGDELEKLKWAEIALERMFCTKTITLGKTLNVQKVKMICMKHQTTFALVKHELRVYGLVAHVDAAVKELKASIQ